MKPKGRPRLNRFNVRVAMIFVLQNKDATLPMVARQYCVPFQVLRGVIYNHYGSLANYRAGLPRNTSKVKTWKRPCMSCGCTKPREYGQYRCDVCKSKDNRHYEGVV